jgi:hypothetical protein
MTLRSIQQAAAIALALIASGCATPTPATDSQPAVIAAGSGDIVQDKNFPLLTLLAGDRTASAAVIADPGLAAIGARGAEALKKAYACGASTQCAIDAMMLSEADIALAGDRLAALAAPGAPLNALVRDRMRPTGYFQRHAALDDAGLMRAAWLETASGVNRLYRVYGLGEAPRYPAIDAISYKPETPEYRALVRAILETEMDDASQKPFFASWMRAGLDLLVVNQRNEAARYEPMAQGVNAAAFARARTLDWSKAPHVAILVPGAGTLPGETGLSAAGALRIRLAARRYEQGLAPFLIVSGGHVHPNKTPYAEAIEMKRELMMRYGVPENAIVVDPHARHTTTNLRNGVRLIHAMGAPAAGTLLVTTSRDQSFYVQSPVFSRRNDEELGYQPLTFVSRLSPNDVVMAQNLMSLHIDPRDPLDP